MMMNEQYQAVARQLATNQPLFRALGDMARQHIIMVLAQAEERLSVGELARRTELSRPAVSHHLRILKEAGLLRETRQGVKRYYYPSFVEAIKQVEVLVADIKKAKELM